MLGTGEENLRKQTWIQEVQDRVVLGEGVDTPAGGLTEGGNVFVCPDAPHGKSRDWVGEIRFAQDLVSPFAADPEHLGDFGVGHDRWRRTHRCTLER